MSNGESTPKKILDCKGLSCPIPLVKIGQALRQMELGELLEVLADDLAFEDDVKAFIEQTQQEIISVTQEGPLMNVLIRKKH